MLQMCASKQAHRSQIVDKHINPNVEEWERTLRFPAHTLFRQLGAAGLLGVDMPTAYGGLGLSLSYNIAVMEELGGIECGGVPMAIGVQASMATPALAQFGSDALRQQFLTPTIAGEQVVCLGVSEVGAGSDVASIMTTARRDGDDLIINGGKMWTTNGAQADWMCLLANTTGSGSGTSHKNKSLICVPLNTPGVTRSAPLHKMGMHSSDTVQMHFDNVRVPAANIIGDEGMGFTYQMLQFQNERMVGVALCM
jgi:citronellyl-CoA dehydrogenase